MFSSVAKTLPLSSAGRLLMRPVVSVNKCRLKSYLSEDFQCKAAWAERLKSPIFSRVDMSKYFFEIERKFQLEGRGSAIDVDIFSNATQLTSGSEHLSEELSIERLDQLEELLRRFRKTEQTCTMLESTPHAVVRAFTDVGRTDNLMRIINNRIEFGIFPDNYTLTFLIDHFLSKENFRDAAKLAVAMMLQEDYRIPIASQLGLFATYSYAKDLKLVTEPWDPQPPPPVEEPEDEVKVRVPFLESSYRDDHFDLTLREHLLGKTLAKFARHGCLEGVKDSAMAQLSLELLGWTLFEKWEKVSSVAESIGNLGVAKECLEQSQSLAEESFTKMDEVTKSKVEQSFASLASVASDFDVKSFLEAEAEKTVSLHEKSVIENHMTNMKRWNEERENELERQLQIFLRDSKLKELSQAKDQLREEEEKLFFFDNFEKMEEEKRSKFVTWRKTWPRKSNIKMSIENHDPYKT